MVYMMNYTKASMLLAAIAGLMFVGILSIDDEKVYFNSVASTEAVKLNGTPYSRMTCSQFACLVTGHKAATAKELYDEGKPLTGELHDGDIVCFHGAHVGVWTAEGLMDSTPERGVGLVTKINRFDPWYAGSIRIVRTR